MLSVNDVWWFSEPSGLEASKLSRSFCSLVSCSRKLFQLYVENFKRHGRILWMVSEILLSQNHHSHLRGSLDKETNLSTISLSAKWFSSLCWNEELTERPKISKKWGFQNILQTHFTSLKAMFFQKVRLELIHQYEKMSDSS